MNEKLIVESFENVYNLIKQLQERITKLEAVTERLEKEVKSLSEAIVELEEEEE